MKDRAVTDPGRVLFAPESGGTPYYAVMERADNPVEPGTPLNKATLLTDTVAELLGLTGDNATPNNAFNALIELLAKKAALASPALTGTPTAPTPIATSGDTQIANKKYVLDNGGIGTLTFVQRFTSNGIFDPTLATNVSKGNRYIFNIQAGGGGGARYTGVPQVAAGGGAGAFLKVELIATSPVTITVGTGGSGVNSTSTIAIGGNNGTNSSISYSDKTYAASYGRPGTVLNSNQATGGRGGGITESPSGDPRIIMLIPGQFAVGANGGNSPLGSSEGSGLGYGYGGTNDGVVVGNGGPGCVEVYRYV